MSSDYYSLEKTAEVLGINTGDVTRLRESGKVRAFKDGSSWKFRKKEIDDRVAKLIRDRHAHDNDVDNDNDDNEVAISAPSGVAVAASAAPREASLDEVNFDDDDVIDNQIQELKVSMAKKAPPAEKVVAKDDGLSLAPEDDGLSLAPEDEDDEVEHSGIHSYAYLAPSSNVKLAPGSDQTIVIQHDSDSTYLVESSPADVLAVKKNKLGLSLEKEDDLDDEDLGVAKDTFAVSGDEDNNDDDEELLPSSKAKKPEAKKAAVADEDDDFLSMVSKDDSDDGGFDLTVDSNLVTEDSESSSQVIAVDEVNPYGAAASVDETPDFTSPGFGGDEASSADAFGNDPFATPAPSGEVIASKPSAVVAEPEFDAFTISVLLIPCLILVGLVSMLAFDLLVNIWSWNETGIVNGVLLGPLTTLLGM